MAASFVLHLYHYLKMERLKKGMGPKLEMIANRLRLMLQRSEDPEFTDLKARLNQMLEMIHEWNKVNGSQQDITSMFWKGAVLHTVAEALKDEDNPLHQTVRNVVNNER
jgi:hypothetical protein